jgi:uncharacterized protein (TIGR02147 family)
MNISSALKTKLFEERDYRQFLKKLLADHKSTIGYKSLLASHAGCQPAYFSQVMAEKAELTPEHAERLCAFWGLNDIESDFFFHLVLLGRAGTISLRKRLEKKLGELRKDWKTEKSTFGKKSVEEASKSMIYYSHWMHSAVHLLLTIPALQNEKALAKHLKKSDAEILSILKKLEQAGLVEKDGPHWRALQVQIHAAEEDFFAEVHHKNWRAQALEVRNENTRDVIRYTSVHSLSKDDFGKIQAMIEEMIQNSRLTIEASPEEMGACLLIDYFGFGKD